MKFQLRNFPFDIQVCDLKLSSLRFPSCDMPVKGFVSLNNKIETIVGYIFLTKILQGNGEWTALNITAVQEEYEGDYAVSFSSISFRLTLKRSTNYYIFMVIIPSFMLTILCVFGLFWEEVSLDSYMDNVFFF